MDRRRTRSGLFFIPFLAIVFAGYGCQHVQPVSTIPNLAQNDVVEENIREDALYSEVYVSECPKEVKTVVYKGVASDNDSFPVTVRQDNKCYKRRP